MAEVDDSPDAVPYNGDFAELGKTGPYHPTAHLEITALLERDVAHTINVYQSTE